MYNFLTKTYNFMIKIHSKIMKIRKKHTIKDRIKTFLLLFGVAIVLGILSNIVHEHSQERKSASIEQLLENALKPVGTTMYIWGGGWNDADSGSGGEATKLGLSKKWKSFMKTQDKDYDFAEHRFEREKGLDCSGFVGWVLYNTFEMMEGKTGYVTTSTDMAESLAKRGWGKLLKNPREFLPGDIVSMEGHVWICLGTCADGSVLLVHSSPPGVTVCGTPSKRTAESIAIQLATEYMETYHSEWQEKYPNRKVELSYLENVVLFRWSKAVMEDAERIQVKSAEEIMGILSPAMKKKESS